MTRLSRKLKIIAVKQQLQKQLRRKPGKKTAFFYLFSLWIINKNTGKWRNPLGKLVIKFACPMGKLRFSFFSPRPVYGVNSLKARANARNIVGPNMLRAFAHHVVCCDLLEVVGWSLKLVKLQSQHFYCFAVIEAWSNNVAFVCTAHPTMLRRRTRTTFHVSTQIHANKKSTWRRRWKTSQSPLYSHLKTQHVVTCCERLHTSANIAQQETTLLGPTMLRVVASVCTGLKTNY